MASTYESRLADKQALFIKREVMPRLATVDSIVFDIDGVIVDVSESFRVVICEAVRIYAEQVLKWDVDVALLTPDETELFKRAGGFNSDWDLVQAAMLFYLFKGVRHGVKKASALRKLPPHLEDFTMEIARAGGGLENAERVILSQCNPAMRRELAQRWQRRLIVQIFQELYAGDKWCPYLYGFRPQYVHGDGYIEKEQVLLDSRRIPTWLKLGVLTGRTRREAELALRRAGISELIPERHWLTDDDGIRKPDPRALWLVLDRIGARRAIYIGDAVDDLDTVKNYCEWAPSGYPRVLFCAVLTGPVGERNRSFFMERSADMVAPNVNFVLDYMRAVREWQTVVARSER